MSQICDEGFPRSTKKLFEIVRSVQGIDERLEVELRRRGHEGVEFRVGMKMEDEGKGATGTSGVGARESHLQIPVGVATHRQAQLTLRRGGEKIVRRRLHSHGDSNPRE